MAARGGEASRDESERHMTSSESSSIIELYVCVRVCVVVVVVGGGALLFSYGGRVPNISLGKSKPRPIESGLASIVQKTKSCVNTDDKHGLAS